MQVMSPGMQMNVASGVGMQMGMMSPSKQSSQAASPTDLTPSVSPTQLLYHVHCYIQLH